MNGAQKIPLGGRDENDSIMGGVDTSGQDKNIRDTAVRRLQNLIPDKDGFPIRRGTLKYEADLSIPLPTIPGGAAAGNQVLAGDGGDTGVAQISPIWCGVPSNLGGVLAYANMPNGNQMNLLISRIGGSGWITSALAIAPDRLPCMFGDGINSYIIFGDNKKGRAGIKIVTDGSELGFHIEDFAFNGTNSTFRPKLAVNYKTRVVYAQGNKVVFSDNLLPLTIGNNAVSDRDIVLGAEDSEDLTTIKRIMLTAEGTPSQTGILAMKRTGAWLLTGDAGQTTDTNYFGTLDVNQIETPGGCVSQDSVCQTPWGTIWCGPDDIWFMPFRSVPIPIGRKISTILKAQPESQSFRIHASYFGGFYRLALFSDGQGPDYYTPLGEQWWLDLRDGPPMNWEQARWYGPQIFKVASTNTAGRGIDITVQGTHFMCIDDRRNAGHKLIGVHAGLVADLVSGTAGITYVSYDNPDSRDIGGLNRTGFVRWQQGQSYNIGDQIVVEDSAYNVANGRGTLVIYYVYAVTGDSTSGAVEPAWTAGTYVDNNVSWVRVSRCMSPSQMAGSEALAQVFTKDYDFGTRMQEKIFLGMELNYFLTIPERLTLGVISDGGKNTETITKDLDNSSGPLIGTDMLEVTGDLVLSEEFASETFLPSDNVDRVNWKSAQLQIAETAGIVIPGDDNDPSDDSLTVGIVVNAVEYTGLLTTRFYANATALANAVIVAVQANATLWAALSSSLVLTKAYTRIVLTGGHAWAPSIATGGIRHIWSLLGMNTWNSASGSETAIITGDEIPFDYGVGQIAFNEAFLLYRAFRRRPNK